MSKDPKDFIDPDFWKWYKSKGIDWIMNSRLDILIDMYEAYEDSIPDVNTSLLDVSIKKPIYFVGSDEEYKEFEEFIKKFVSSKSKKYKKIKKAINSNDILSLRNKLNDLKWRVENENNKST
jgi:hypothetical protein